MRAELQANIGQAIMEELGSVVQAQAQPEPVKSDPATNEWDTYVKNKPMRQNSPKRSFKSIVNATRMVQKTRTQNHGATRTTMISERMTSSNNEGGMWQQIEHSPTRSSSPLQQMR